MSMKSAVSHMRTILTSTAAVAALVGMGGTAQAQSAPVDESAEADAHSAIQEIVVTARRVSENLQDIPISVGTLNQQELEARDISDFQDLKASIVGLTTSRTGTAAGGYVTIRGITPVATPQPASDQGVGFFIDGISIARSQGAGAPLVDIARVEVLRGPQGTLFGRNSSIGSINFITNAPVDEFQASASVDYGNYNQLAVEGMVNIPITPDLIARFAYKHREIDGDVKNSNTSPGFIYPEPFGALPPADSFAMENTESYLAKLRFTGIEGVTIDYKYDREEMILTPGSAQLTGFNPGSPLLALLSGIYGIQQGFVPGAVTPSFTRLSSVSEDHAPEQSVKNDGHMLDINIDLATDVTLRSITGYRTTKSSGASDLDGGAWFLPFPVPIAPGVALPAGPLCVSCSVNYMDQHAWSQELQLLGKTGALDYVLGAYYFDEHAYFTNTYSVFGRPPYAPATYTPTTGQVTPPLGTPGDYVLGNNGIYDNLSYALYGHLDYVFSDAFDVSLGLRHTWDKRRTDDRRPFGGGLGKYSDSRLTYDAALNFHPSDDVLIFAKYARGYTSGGIDSNISFLPEVNDQVELGFKGDFLDRTLRVNASIYQSWIKNRQSTVPNTSSGAGCSPVLIAAGFTPGNCPVGLFVFNLPGTTKVKGFELELVMQPTDGLTFTGNFSYNDPKFSTGEFHRAPKTNLSFSAQYDFPKFGNGAYLTARLDGDYRGAYYATGGNVATSFTGTVPAGLRGGLSNEAYLAALRKASIAGDYFLVNGRLAIADIPIGGTKVQLAGYVRNIFNTHASYFTVNLGATYHSSFERPRTYGVKLSAAF